MERTITVIATNSNDKKVFTSNATTLGELKAEMDVQNIDYHNMDFMEGLSHTTMIDDSAILPSNIQYKGNVTNNLVFMLSTTNKHIRSGAYTRQECYTKIKALNLQDAVKENIGRNFTQVSTETLNTLISNFESNKPDYSNKANVETNDIIPTSRGALYTYIKEHNIADNIKVLTGKNYTNLATNVLIRVCNEINGSQNNQVEKSCCKGCASKTVGEKPEPTIVKKAKLESPYSEEELDALRCSLLK